MLVADLPRQSPVEGGMSQVGLDAKVGRSVDWLGWRERKSSAFGDAKGKDARKRGSQRESTVIDEKKGTTSTFEAETNEY